MARAAGMPARLVTGYSSGTYDYNAHHFVVVDANSHAWPEIFFPGIGWVEFEPTTNLSPISHPGEDQNPANAITGLPTPVPAKKGFALDIQWDEIVGPLEILLGILAGLGFLLWSSRLKAGHYTYSRLIRPFSPFTAGSITGAISGA